MTRMFAQIQRSWISPSQVFFTTYCLDCFFLFPWKHAKGTRKHEFQHEAKMGVLAGSYKQRAKRAVSLRTKKRNKNCVGLLQTLVTLASCHLFVLFLHIKKREAWGLMCQTVTLETSCAAWRVCRQGSGCWLCRRSKFRGCNREDWRTQPWGRTETNCRVREATKTQFIAEATLNCI